MLIRNTPLPSVSTAPRHAAEQTLAVLAYHVLLDKSGLNGLS